MRDDGPIQGWNRALAFSARHHGDAFRKGSRRPYVTHVVAVAETLAHHYPERDALITAGLLHDVVEDTGVTFELVRDEFGAAVERLVRAVSKDDAAMEQRLGATTAELTAGLERDEADRVLWRRRRAFLLQNLQAGDAHPDVLRLMAADAHANLADVTRSLRDPRVGTAVWDLFTGGRHETLQYYRKVARAVRSGLGVEPLVTELEGALAALEREAAEAAAAQALSYVAAPCSVRLATAADADLVAPMYDAFRQHHGRAPDTALARAFLRERIATRSAMVLIAQEASGTAVGYVRLVAGYSSVQALPCYVLADLYVDPLSRRQGVGRALMRASEELARAAGAIRIELRARIAHAPARALYESLGWQRVEDLHHYVLLL